MTVNYWHCLWDLYECVCNIQHLCITTKWIDGSQLCCFDTDFNYSSPLPNITCSFEKDVTHWKQVYWFGCHGNTLLSCGITRKLEERELGPQSIYICSYRFIGRCPTNTAAVVRYIRHNTQINIIYPLWSIYRRLLRIKI